ncbi:DNA (cytosine-5-)-methyltransferase [Alphaproteobacteria bacterium]|nr:DNA (cytosine-5-)-methyltransferase [Alphaproteobacteria bacterium]
MTDFSTLVKQKRDSFGMSQKDFATLLGLNDNGERTVRGWENGEHKPSPARRLALETLKTEIPFKHNANQESLRTIDLFAGIGGIRLAFQNLGASCVFSSEWDKYSRKTYAANFGELPHGDITKITGSTIPDHDILLAGFPCQAFSQAGLRKGFGDTRGTLFFDIQKILVAKRPRMFLLENVKQLRGHDKGKTLQTILDILRGKQSSVPSDLKLSKEVRSALSTKLNYWVDFRVLRSADFGVPQNRERVYIVGFDRGHYGDPDFDAMFSWPPATGLPTSVRQILQSHNEVDDKYTISQRLLDGHIRRKKEHREKGNGFGFSVFTPDQHYTNTISARYYKDGSEILIDQSDLGRRPRKLTPRECARLQGYPEEFIVDAVSDAQAYRQFGNSVSVPVVQAVASKMLEFERLHSAL